MKRMFSFYYFMFFVAGAASQPFLSLFLSSKGINGTKIGLLLAAASGAGILAQPILGFMNDRAADPRRLILLSAILSPIIFLGYAGFQDFWILLAISILFAIVQSTSPILDAITVEEGIRSGFNYGHIRLWGALSFALTTMVAGFAYHKFGLGLAFIVYVGAGIILTISTCYLPRPTKRTASQENMLSGIWNVARDMKLLFFILVCFVLSICVAINFGFLSLYYQSLHYPMAWVGINFTVAALIEVPFFYLSGKLMARFGRLPIIVSASLLYASKYAIMALAPGVVIVIAAQLLDGIAYALYWSASVELVAELAPAGRTATAQTLYGAVAGSLSNIIGSALGGFLFDHDGAKAMYGYTSLIATFSCICFIAFARIAYSAESKR